MTPGDLYAKRKFKLFMIPQQEILKIFTKEAEIINFPENAVFADCGYRIDAQGFAILICHDSYDEVPMKSAAPMVQAKWKTL